MAGTRKIIGATAGVAAAAAAGLAVAHKRRSRVYHVRPADDGWVLEAEGAKRPESTYQTKRAAVSAARSFAAGKAPSELVIHRADGTIQDRHAYDPED